MGQTQVSRMQQIRTNPPHDLTAATNLFLSKHQRALVELTCLQETGLDEYYIKIADSSGSSPLAALMGDISTLSCYGAFSGIRFVNTRHLGTLSLGTTIFLNGDSGIGKSLQIEWERNRMQEFTKLLVTDYRRWMQQQEDVNDGDIEMTPANPASGMDFNAVSAVDCSWNRSNYEHVKFFISPIYSCGFKKYINYKYTVFNRFC